MNDMELNIWFDNTMRERFEYPDPSVPFIVWTGDLRTMSNSTIVCHWHNEFEYGVLLSGELDYNIDGQHIHVKQGDAVFINANSMHMATQVGNTNVIVFTVSFLPSLFTGGKDGTLFRKYFQPILQSSIRGFSIPHTIQNGNPILQLLHEIYSLNRTQTENYELLCISLISRLWNLTLCYIKEHKHEFIAFRTNCKNEKKAKDILSYIHEHYAENLQIEQIAKHIGISRSECFRCFQRYTNVSPIAYLTEYRLAHAIHLLTETDKSMTQIATECGFSNSSYFGKIFKKKYAVSPSHFKEILATVEIKQ